MGTRVFVGNVNPQTTREVLQQLFSQVGRVLSIFIPLDRDTGRPRGFAFVDYSDSAEAARAIGKLDGHLVAGKRLRLSWALEQRSQSRPGEAGRRSQRASPVAAEPEPWTGDADIEDYVADRTAGREARRRRGGKHGSDRRHGQGTRRFIE